MGNSSSQHEIPSELLRSTAALKYLDFIPSRLQKDSVWEPLDEVWRRADTWRRVRSRTGELGWSCLQVLYTPASSSSSGGGMGQQRQLLTLNSEGRIRQAWDVSFQAVRVWYTEPRDPLPLPSTHLHPTTPLHFVDFAPKLVRKRLFRKNEYETPDMVWGRLHGWLDAHLSQVQLVGVQRLWRHEPRSLTEGKSILRASRRAALRLTETETAVTLPIAAQLWSNTHLRSPDFARRAPDILGKQLREMRQGGAARIPLEIQDALPGLKSLVLQGDLLFHTAASGWFSSGANATTVSAEVIPRNKLSKGELRWCLLHDHRLTVYRTQPSEDGETLSSFLEQRDLRGVWMTLHDLKIKRSHVLPNSVIRLSWKGLGVTEDPVWFFTAAPKQRNPDPSVACFQDWVSELAVAALGGRPSPELPRRGEGVANPAAAAQSRGLPAAAVAGGRNPAVTDFRALQSPGIFAAQSDPEELFQPEQDAAVEEGGAGAGDKGRPAEDADGAEEEAEEEGELVSGESVHGEPSGERRQPSGPKSGEGGLPSTWVTRTNLSGRNRVRMVQVIRLYYYPTSLQQKPQRIVSKAGFGEQEEEEEMKLPEARVGVQQPDARHPHSQHPQRQQENGGAVIAPVDGLKRPQMQEGEAVNQTFDEARALQQQQQQQENVYPVLPEGQPQQQQQPGAGLRYSAPLKALTSFRIRSRDFFPSLLHRSSVGVSVYEPLGAVLQRVSEHLHRLRHPDPHSPGVAVPGEEEFLCVSSSWMPQVDPKKDHNTPEEVPLQRFGALNDFSSRIKIQRSQPETNAPDFIQCVTVWTKVYS